MTACVMRHKGENEVSHPCNNCSGCSECCECDHWQVDYVLVDTVFGDKLLPIIEETGDSFFPYIVPDYALPGGCVRLMPDDVVARYNWPQPADEYCNCTSPIHLTKPADIWLCDKCRLPME